ncbi:MAG: hypothetical protein PHG48_07630 [Eubacteriales bacterium]|nr:hypothetical protein [Eubacteriales bacterium]
MKQALMVYVYRAGIGDATNGGVSSRVDRLLLAGEGIEGPFEVDDDEHHLELRKKNVGGEEYMYAVPVDGRDTAGMVGPMFGGNFVYSSDSRFRRVCKYPIPVHDRWETQQMYDSLSR